MLEVSQRDDVKKLRYARNVFPHLVYFAAGTKPPALSFRNVRWLHRWIETPKVVGPSTTIAVDQ
jgi:hypothetical protein